MSHRSADPTGFESDLAEDPHLSSASVEISSGPFDPSLAGPGYVFEPLSEWAQKCPDKPAILSTRKALSYRELERTTNELARLLRKKGVQRGDLVALLLPRGHEAVLSIIAVLKAGAAYVPLDADTPSERIRQCLEDAPPQLIITKDLSRHSELTGTYEALEISYLLEHAPLECGDPIPMDELGLLGTDLAYAIFTSGTTGRPKGVPITHASLTNFVRGDQEACIRVEPHDRVLQAFSPASDGHHEEIWPAIKAGATLVVAGTEEVYSGIELGSFMETHQVSIVSCAPTLLSMVERDVPSIRRILFGAEKCPSELVRRWWRPGREILNTYGPTEATVGATYALCTPDSPITIGRPLPNYYCYILDPALNPVKQGGEGELCIAGIGVSMGYLGNGSLTAEKFVQNPFASADNQNSLLYRTGDRVRLNEDGNIEWLGRIDSQVKIRGYRIEVSDIESHILQSPGVRSSVVVLRDAESASPHLAALIVPTSEGGFDATECMGRLRREMPAYMAPQVLEEVESIPVLPSGKIDRKAAQSLRGISLQAARHIVEPRTRTERLVLEIWQQIFPGMDISCKDDFFLDLGGYSILATHCVSKLRGGAGLGMVSVLDLYQNPTLDGLARLIDAKALTECTREKVERPKFAEVPAGRYALATAIQGLGILFLFGYRAAFWLAPVICASYGVFLEWPHWKSVALGLFVHAVSVPIGLLIAVALKWVVIGRFRPGTYPMWGGYFLRWWFVERLLDMAPRIYITGTPLASVFLRLLGSKVGCNSVFETLDIDCPDLLEVGRDCVIEERSWIRSSHVGDGVLTIKPVSIAAGCVVGVRSGVAGGATLGEGAFLADLSCAGEGTHIPAGEEWSGSPARRRDWRGAPRYDPADQPSDRRLLVFGILQSILAILLPLIDTVPFLLTALVFYQSSDEFHTYLLVPVYAVLFTLGSCVQLLFLKWIIIGRMKPGIYRLPSLFTLRKWVVDKLIEVETSSIVPIYDTLYARPWCIALGMKCGSRSEIALPARLPYDLVELGEESFLCSDTSVGMPLRRNGKMTLERTVIERRGFLGNDSVITQGTRWPAESLLGALSATPRQSEIGTGPGQVWLGSPSTRLPGRQHFDQFDAERTYNPTLRLYAQRLIHETFRIILPGVASLLTAALMLNVFDLIWEEKSIWLAVLSIPFLDVMAAVAGLAFLWALKKVLIGTYRPTIQPLWSHFVWKTETFATFLHDFAAPLFMAPMLGTPYLCATLRFMGARVGKRAFIDTNDLTEFDLLSIGEDAALNFNAPLQAHLFEDRVMKMGKISIGDRCSVGNYSVVLLESEMEPDSHVGNISLVMKGETIPSGTFWEGCPAQGRNDSQPILVGQVAPSVLIPPNAHILQRE